MARSRNKKAGEDVKATGAQPNAAMKPSGRRRRNSKSETRGNAFFDTRNNRTLSQMSTEAPVGDRKSLVYPAGSASAQATPNFTTAPGQENFIADTNVVTKESTDQATFSFAFYAQTRGTSNAMRIDVVHYFGALSSNKFGVLSSPIELAALNLKQYIDTSFGTNTNYDTQDLMMYLMAVSAVFPIIAEIKRDIRLTVTYVQNAYPAFVPKGLFALLGIGDATNNYAAGEGALYAAQTLRSNIDMLNQIIIAFNRLPIPPELGIFQLNDDLFDSILCDTEDLQTAQLYAFHNSQYWYYHEDEETGTVSLRHKPFGSNGHSVHWKIQILAGMVEKISALRTSSTAMLQNLFNAYGSKDTLQVETLDVNNLEPLPLEHNLQKLSMIENMVLCPDNAVVFSDIVPDHETSTINGFVSVRPETTNDEMSFNLPLQFHKPLAEITSDDIGWALRMHPVFLTYKKLNGYADGEALTPNTLYSANYSPFLYAVGCWTAKLWSTGNMVVSDLSSRNVDKISGDAWVYLDDFKYAPIVLKCYNTSSGNANNYHLQWYKAKRDVEANIKLGNLQMYWTYMTLDLWGSNINRGVAGSRTRS